MTPHPLTRWACRRASKALDSDFNPVSGGRAKADPLQPFQNAIKLTSPRIKLA